MPVQERIKNFAFTNTAGGTGLSDWQYNERYSGQPTVTAVKGWHDYETGYRFIGESDDPALNTYLDRVAKASDRRVFFGESDVWDQRQLQALVDELYPTTAVCG